MDKWVNKGVYKKNMLHGQRELNIAREWASMCIKNIIDSIDDVMAIIDITPYYDAHVIRDTKRKHWNVSLRALTRVIAYLLIEEGYKVLVKNGKIAISEAED